MKKMDFENQDIIKRNIYFDLEEYTDPTWFEGDPVRTAYCDALSLSFPEGERLFIKAVRHYGPKIEDEKLRRDIDAFIMQEAFHTREHETYNRGLRKQGLDIDHMEERVKKSVMLERNPFWALMATIVVEHITSTFAHIVLNDDTLLEKVPVAYRDIWTWHALEEMEHKAVAFDVFEAAFPDMPRRKKYFLRCITLITVTYDMHRVFLLNMRDILRARGYSITLPLLLHMANIALVRPGFYRRGMGYYFSFFLPWFHPARAKREPLADKWVAYFAERMEKKDSKYA